MTRLNRKDVCQRFALSPRCLDNMIATGRFPPGVRIGKSDYWCEEVLERWTEMLFMHQKHWKPGM